MNIYATSYWKLPSEHFFGELRAVELRFNPHHDEKGRFCSGNGLTNGGKSGKINLEIDTLTPCLINAKTGEIIQTSIEQIHPNKSDFKDWEFDWSKPESKGYSVYALKAEGDSRIQGLIATKSDPINYAINIDIVESAPHNNTHNKNNVGGKKEYEGVGGHLFAEACRQSKEAGYDGYVFFDAKNNLIPHYQSKLGAMQIGSSQRMIIDETSAQKLIDKYYGGK